MRRERAGGRIIVRLPVRPLEREARGAQPRGLQGFGSAAMRGVRAAAPPRNNIYIYTYMYYKIHVYIFLAAYTTLVLLVFHARTAIEAQLMRYQTNMMLAQR